ncbi:MAG: LptF/LptG family permease [Verrucomicrobia bacterium]|nr:LptF/LptG family permease [Verrucomicrobiota bacterium]
MRAVNTFDRHLLREWLQILGLVLAATCGLLVVQVLYNDLRSLRELGARGWVLWRYLGVTLPSFLAVVLPVALLISLMYTLGKLHRANEITAMRAAGVGFIRLTAPVWLVGVLCCGLSWWLNTTVVPWSVEESRSMQEELGFQRDAKSLTPDRVGAAYSVAFDNAREQRMWFFNRFSRFTQRGYGVAVSELDTKRREVTRLVAAEAWPEKSGKGWVFKNGRELTFVPATGELLGSVPFAEKVMAKYHEDPQLMLLIDRRPVDLSLHELREIVAYLESEGNPKSVPYAVRFFGLISDTLVPLLVIAMAIPFSVTGVRVNPAVGVSKSIGLFFLYYIMMWVASSLAAKQIVDPSVAAWLPNIGMGALALWFFARMR